MDMTFTVTLKIEEGRERRCRGGKERDGGRERRRRRGERKQMKGGKKGGADDIQREEREWRKGE